ncbi:MAG: flagellar basal body-associated protein FliL [Nitrospiria bacterium]
MAEEEKKESAVDKDAPKKGSPMKLILIAIGALMLGAGGSFFLLNKPPAKEATAVEGEAKGKEKAKEEAVEEAEEGVEIETEEIIIFNLEPFVVNLSDSPESRYLKVTLNLDLIKAEYADDVTKHLPQIRDSLLILFSSKKYAGIRTVEGKMELRDEILQRINGVFGKKKVKMAYFMDFVTQ